MLDQFCDYWSEIFMPNAGIILTIPKGSTPVPPTLNVGSPQLTIVDGSPKVSYSNSRASAINFVNFAP